MQTVKDLIALLSNLPQDAKVVIAKDSEGNQYSPWSGDHGKGHYVPETTYSGEFMCEDDEDAQLEVQTVKDMTQAPDDELVPCIVLWPSF